MHRTERIGIAAILVVALGALGSAQAQTAAGCANPRAIGVSRTIEIDATGGPRFGLQFSRNSLLNDGEVILTFDDGPLRAYTRPVLEALAQQCTKATFFVVGRMAVADPDLVQEYARQGHTVGTHTWSHTALVNKKLSEDQRKEEIEKGFSAVKWALGGVAPAPFFRFPALQHPPEMVTYLGERNIAIFSCDLDSFDFKARNAQQIIDTVMRKLEKNGKGIVLMHDFHKHTAEALPELLKRLKAGGYKVVAMRAKAPVQTLAQYDEAVIKELKLPTVSNRPLSSVVTDVSQ